MGTVYTIGYEKSPIEQFLATLLEAGITTLVDVRDVPWSRREDFAKGDLSEVLTAANIAYLHLKGLGNPPDGRDAARVGEMDTYHRLYQERLSSGPGRRAIADVGSLAGSERPCLMCYERDPERCHRLILSEKLASEHDLEIKHLYPPLRDGQMTLL